ncbi:FAD-dependent thymidylate synthase [Brumicola nitratireducens]|uniref:FAD-dependent thymidylate synthase n=1 Tax=Glaciecola nitratireducens (strain JCM 12485 / KCTC 12276 / FR1064) TaxID=1085623 RepID=G4QGX5_GLANF|nr:FAD-dependent thymidylate synthase [Glaciecola nitratireducens]AEP29920.1 thymidylate synthase, flavin-dependent [Glaciecola nitratireducens FR1064]
MKAEYVDRMGNDLSVVNAARVSFNKTSSYVYLDEDGNEVELKVQDGISKDFLDPPKVIRGKDVGLIKFLAKHHHWTPFAHTAITLRMQAPIPIRTQAFKHKVGLIENEESRRYISTAPDYFTPTFRQQASDKKQGSGEAFDPSTQTKLQSFYDGVMSDAVSNYDYLLELGVAEEQARFVLPQGCEVNWVWTGNLVSFANFVNKRSKSDAQGEIQDLAKQVNDVIAPLFPHSWAALTS